MVTLNFSLNASTRSARSVTDMVPMASRMSSLLRVLVAMLYLSSDTWESRIGAFGAQRLDDTNELV